MEKDRGSRVISIIALCVAVVGLSIGFAAFTKDLNIAFSESNVKVSGDLDIKFLASADPNDTSTTVNGFVADASSGTIIGQANLATILSDSVTISEIGATFNSKGQGAFYELYIYNNSEYDVYLNAIDFLNYDGAETYKVCTAIEGTTQSLVDDACKDIHVNIFNDSDDNSKNFDIYDTRKNGFTSIKIPKGEIVQVVVSIFYAIDELNSFLEMEETAILPNGDFKINFGDIKFNFSSLEG